MTWRKRPETWTVCGRKYCRHCVSDWDTPKGAHERTYEKLAENGGEAGETEA